MHNLTFKCLSRVTLPVNYLPLLHHNGKNPTKIKIRDPSDRAHAHRLILTSDY